MLNKSIKIRYFFTIVILILLFYTFFMPICFSKSTNYSKDSNKIISLEDFIKETYSVKTSDGFPITFIRYVGYRQPSIILIHGMGGNHRMFDWDDNHSLAQYLNKEGWDVWLLNLRTHDDDGDFLFDKNTNWEYINRYWDFDRTLLKKDVVKAVEFVKEKSENDKIVLGGHSYGGYLAYAYAMMIGEENLSGIITTGACPYANPVDYQPRRSEMLKYGFYFGDKAFVNPFGQPWSYFSKIKSIRGAKYWKPTANSLFYYTTTPEYIQREIYFHVNSEPAGVVVDMYFGKDPYKYEGHWVDPQTLYDYSENLYKINVPIIFIAGVNDTQDPSDGIFRAYANVSSQHKEFYSFVNHSHMDLLWGRYCNNLIFPKIDNFLEKIEIC